MNTRPSIQPFFDPGTWTVSYVVSDPATRSAAVIDPVLDYDFKSGHTGTRSADAVLAHLAQQRLAVQWILETHAHADHLSAARYLQQQVGGRIAIGRNIREVQATFKKIYNMAYRVGGAVFVGDTLFMPDVGSARADFPGGDAHTLYRSMRRLLDLPPETRMFVCHDYPPAGREPRWETTVAEQRAHNIHVRDGIGEAEFVAMRRARDATLEVPTLILPAIQVNVRAGQLPPADDNGVAYLRIPLNALPRGAEAR
jgi:glyoxylase-like metal-dependent hydrolase (beta-lactamase superfamily II)